MTKKAGKRKTKKPKWTILTFAQIERRRKELGFSKARMALSLEVTNSTYHNWRRGTTVPHPNQQEILKAKMALLNPKTEESPTTEAMFRSNLALPNNGNGSATIDALSGISDTHESDQCMSHRGRRVSSMSRAYAPPVPGLAAIVVAFIESQSKPPSADSIVSFANELREVLSS